MNFCYKTADIWQVVGKGIYILKIIVPLLIIILVSIDLFKMVTKGDDKGLKEVGGKLFKRFISAIIIFFIPTLISALFNLVSLFSSDMKNDYGNCVKCLTSPYKECDTSYEGGIYK